MSTYLPLASAVPWGPRSPEIQFLWSHYIRPLGTLRDKDSPEEMPDTRMVCCPHRKMVNSLPCFTGNFQTVLSPSLSILKKSQNHYGLSIRGDGKCRFGKIWDIWEKCVDFIVFWWKWCNRKMLQTLPTWAWWRALGFPCRISPGCQGFRAPRNKQLQRKTL